uniref:UV radiation resistance-associated gene protein n=1 Tax=Gouania willdenowi TaxID=441366 RepID=A0A8C5EXI3_GOUWI
MNSITGRVLALPAASVTNSGASSSRSLHVELTSQQRRLRHLRSIAARNIVNKNGSPLLDTYFTLHLCLGESISRGQCYRLMHIHTSTWELQNPTWRSLDFGMLPDLLDTSVSCFVVRIWGGQEDHYQLLIEWMVNLDGLRYTGQQIRSRNPNEIIFGLNDGYYSADFDHKDQSERKKNSLLQVDPNAVRNSYSVFSLLRLHTAQRAIKQTQVTVQKIGKEIEEKLRTTATCTEKKKERECMQLRIAVLRSELQRQRKALGREFDLRQKDRLQLTKKEEVFSAQHDSLHEERSSLSKLEKECAAKREQFLKFNAQLTFRCRQLLSELSYIYPIDVANQSDYVICGVKLPNSEEFQAKDDGSVAVALGYTSHLVLMISCFLQIPLRYPVIHKGSRSSIKDTITDRLTEKEREFPLYSRGERFHFEYGVYLLNKNIAQLRYQHGLTTPDLQQTLPNLKNFLEHGLMVRCSRAACRLSHLNISTSCESNQSVSDRLRKRASSEAENKCKPPPPHTYNTAVGGASPPSSSPKNLSSTLDGGVTAKTKSPPQYVGAMNGSLVREQAPVGLVPALSCSVEQAEEIMGTEATGLGLGLGAGLVLVEEAQPEDYHCIPVDHAVAVECDDQVLGELDVAGIEECSRRIYALNENMSSFRRPRKNSEK